LGEVLDPQLLGLARRVEGVGVDDDAVAGVALGGKEGADAAPHRAAGEEETVDLRGELVGGGPMGLQELADVVGALRPSLGVGVVEGVDRIAGCLQPLPYPHG
jgi:hypothetical protein